MFFLEGIAHFFSKRGIEKREGWLIKEKRKTPKEIMYNSKALHRNKFFLCDIFSFFM